MFNTIARFTAAATLAFAASAHAAYVLEVDTDGAAEVWVESVALQSPNGLWVHGERLIVATWGPMTDIDTFGSLPERFGLTLYCCKTGTSLSAATRSC